jgi:FkbM family methyltransferase
VQVGAYTGDDGLIDACRRFGHRLYMFEPNPKRVTELEQKAGGLEWIHIVGKAVSTFNGTATFRIAAYDDCSSLQDFDADANQTWVHEWHPYKRFEMVDQVEVPVVRLDTFMAEEGLTTIDRLEVDAQGEDLRVVESLGERIRDVKRIQVEVNISNHPLYRNAFTMDEAVAFFARNGFEEHLSWKQSLNREANVVFRNRRFYPFATVNAVSGAVEQVARTTCYTALKMPRVLEITMGKIRGAVR